MRAALIVNRVGPDRNHNLHYIVESVKLAASSGAQLLLFPEAALTGLINNDDPHHDLPLGETIPGPVTATLSTLCQKHSIWLGIGLLERDKGCLYDTAILFDNQGDIACKYRRMQPQWHGSTANTAVYRQGKYATSVNTPFGSVAFLICGDLFDDTIISHIERMKPDLLLYPFARCFEDGSYDQLRWDTMELPLYVERIQHIGVPALMVNYLADPELHDGNSFGGAYAVTIGGQVKASMPLGKTGILYVNLPLPAVQR